MDWILMGGRVLGEAGLEARPLALTGGRVAETPAPAARAFDAAGLILVPGIVDAHGDGFERNLSPRPGVLFDAETALIETDRQCAANGITTAYLALTISWEPGLRSLEMADTVIETLERLRPALLTDLRVQIRWEIKALDAAAQVEGWLELEPKPAIAFNDHFTGMVRAPAPDAPEFEARMGRDIPKYAARAGMSVEDYKALVARIEARMEESPAIVARIAARAVELGVPRLAHDEKTKTERARHRALGIGVSEFPLTREAAAEAISAGEPTVLGAPNVLRGGSHIGALGAEEAARAGLCSALASDYFYPAPLLAASRLAGQDLSSLGSAWALVSSGPAKALGLTDRGRLAPGLRGDVLALSFTGGRARVEAAFAGGKLVFAAGFARCGF